MHGMRRTRRASAVVFALSWGLVRAAFSSEPARAPDGQFADRAKLIGSDSARMIRIRQDFFTRATGCPLYVVALPSSEGSNVRERAAELFTRWHAEEKRLPDESILLVVFAAEKSGGIVLGPDRSEGV